MTITAPVPGAWGLDGWGTGSWGASGAFGVSRAFALTESSVVVELATPPQARSGFLTGDVFNPGSWTVQRLDSNAMLQVVGVAVYEYPLQYEIRVLERFPGATVTLEVTAVGLLDALGSPISEPDSAQFKGVEWAQTFTADGQAATRGLATRDLANLATPSEDLIGGTLSVVGGDYQLEEGAALVKKLILRRLITAPGDFFHLPDYGIGLRVKQALPVADMVKLQTRIRQQVLLEREVADCGVDLTLEDNHLLVKIRARLKTTGQRVDVAYAHRLGVQL